VNSRERLLRAIEGEEPDIVPVGIHSISTYLPYLKRKLERDIDDYQALKMFGFDPTFYRTFTKGENRSDWRIKEEVITAASDYKIVRVTIDTPKGRLSQVEKRTPITTWTLEPLLKKTEDVDCLAYRPLSIPDIKAYEREFDRLGKEGLIRSFAGGQGDAVGLRGTEQLCLDFYERPSWVSELFEFLTQRSLEYIEGLPSHCIDLVEIAGHIGAFIPPRLFEKFVLPYDSRVVEALHKRGLCTTYHDCGKVMHLLELIAFMGTDCIETLTPPSHGGDVSLTEVKRRVGEKLCLIGGFDQALLERGSQEDAKEGVKRCIEGAAQGGGYILYTTDHFFEAPMENLHAMVEAARRYGRYP